MEAGEVRRGTVSEGERVLCVCVCVSNNEVSFYPPSPSFARYYDQLVAMDNKLPISEGQVSGCRR